jgi:hypothetical protein
MKLNSFLQFSIFLLIYSPIINNRNYIGILFFFLLFLLISFNKNNVKLNKLSIYILFYSLFLIILEFFAAYQFNNELISIPKIIIYNLLPFLTYQIGLLIRYYDFDLSFYKSIFMIGAIQSIISIGSYHINSFRIFLLKNYSRGLLKYNNLFENYGTIRVTGTIGNPNILGIFMVIYLLFLLYFYKRIKIYNFIKNITILFSFVTILYTQSSTSIILLVISLFIYLVFYLSKRSSFRYKKPFFAIPILPKTITQLDYFLRRITLSRISNMGGRLPIWIGLINNLILSEKFNIFYGYGSLFISKYTVDNYYLYLLLSYGLIGFLLFVFLWIAIIRLSFSMNNEKKWYIITIIVIVFISNITAMPLESIKLGLFIYIIIGYFIEDQIFYRKF